MKNCVVLHGLIVVHERDARTGSLVRDAAAYGGACAGDDESGLLRRVSDDFGVVRTCQMSKVI